MNTFTSLFTAFCEHDELGTGVAAHLFMRRARTDHLFLHLLRIGAYGALLVMSLPVVVKVALAAALFFAAFSLAHDAVHGALGLPKRVNTIVMSGGALLMLLSGQAMRRMHLRHHARPLADNDLEGRGARLSFFAALASGPWNALVLRVMAFRGARSRERVVQILETSAGAAIVGLALVTRYAPLVTYVVVAMVLQLTMALWASHIPHHTPAWVVAFCKRLAFLRSPVVLSLAYHDHHHRRPGVPSQELGMS